MEAPQTHANGIAGIHPGAAIPQEGLREVAAILHLKLLFGHAKLVTGSDATLNQTELATTKKIRLCSFCSGDTAGCHAGAKMFKPR